MTKRPVSFSNYPIFIKDGARTIAVLSKNKAFFLIHGGHGKGDGFEFRVIKTRRTILKYLKSCREISYTDFKNDVQNIMGKYMADVSMGLNPMSIEDKKGQNLLPILDQD